MHIALMIIKFAINQCFRVCLFIFVKIFIQFLMCKILESKKTTMTLTSSESSLDYCRSIQRSQCPDKADGAMPLVKWWWSLRGRLPVWLSCSALSFLPASVTSAHQGCCPEQTGSASPARRCTEWNKRWKPCCDSQTGSGALRCRTCSCSAVKDVRALLAGFGWQSWSEGRAPSRVSPVPFKIDAWWQGSLWFHHLHVERHQFSCCGAFPLHTILYKVLKIIWRVQSTST